MTSSGIALPSCLLNHVLSAPFFRHRYTLRVLLLVRARGPRGRCGVHWDLQESHRSRDTGFLGAVETFKPWPTARWCCPLPPLPTAFLYFTGYEVNILPVTVKAPFGYILYPPTSFSPMSFSTTTQPHRPVAACCHNQPRRKRVRA